ncbi:MAG: AAA domain-containing protein [Acidimicrobiales bacterium]|nr:AAA domain-containing protein [Acidimicrobiales bacterium]
MDFSAANIKAACGAEGLIPPDHVVEQLVSALDAEKHVILTGPPGTGKTTLAYLTAEVAQKAMMGTGFLPTTASSEWTTYETVGGFQPTSEGLIFKPGLFVEAITQGAWLIIDELNRANFDRAFGPFFTVLSGSPVVLPYKRVGQSKPLSIVPQGTEPPAGSDPLRVPASWRIIATMNVLDKNLLFEMSYALMRRFTFIEVGCPPTEVYENLLTGPAKIVASFLDFRQIKDLGPAVYIDAGKYVTRRAKDGITKSRALYEVLYAYFLPQFEGMSDEDASELFRMIEPLLDPPEAIEAHRSISQLLGVELVV